MAKLHPYDHGPRVEGKLGDFVYKWYAGNKCVVQKAAKKAKRPRKHNAKAKATHENLRKAIAYAQTVIADPAAKAYYAEPARKLHSQVFWLAKADAMKPPTLRSPIVVNLYDGRAGQPVLIETGDLFRVQTVHITVRDAAGDIVETGAAVRERNKKRFLYRWKRDHPTQQVLTIETVAESRAGHRVSVVDHVTAKATPVPVPPLPVATVVPQSIPSSPAR